METPEIPYYVPPFLWRIWLSNSQSLHHPRIHAYNVYDNELSEICKVPDQTRSVFQDFDSGQLEDGCRSALQKAEQAFSHLEGEAECALVSLIQRTTTCPISNSVKWRTSMDPRALSILRTFFLFLRYRNSRHYRAIVIALRDHDEPNVKGPAFSPHRTYSPLIRQAQRRILLGSFRTFLQDSDSRLASGIDTCQEMEKFCWRFCNSELCIGVATEDQEFIFTDACFGILDEGFINDSDWGDFFFPISPTIALYVLDADESNCCLLEDDPLVWIECGCESASDVHLRNAMLLQSCPDRLYFSSLRSISLSISSYDEFRWIPEHVDYSRLKQRCRQKYTQECVTKTLVIKGSVMITDLTDDIVNVGQSPVAHGSFSDVWEGLWIDPVTKQPKKVALKCLRQVMVQNVKEKLLKRLKDEVIAWHRLQHPNIAHLHGVVQYSNTIAMVSPWCENGTVAHYLGELNPSADRLKLVIEIARGVSYLHNFKPTVIHGDLKGGNILIDEHGRAVITDFGLSKVLGEMSDSVAPGSSFFAGSTRYMSPELVLALVEDDGRPPPVTIYSDIWAFACVCLEIATGQLPYPHRTNDHAVTVDILRGVKPSRGSCCHIHTKDIDSFWSMLDQCWNLAFSLRPTMPVVAKFLESLIDSYT